MAETRSDVKRPGGNGGIRVTDRWGYEYSTEGRSTNEIRHDIDMTRSEMSDTVNELEDRLSPQYVFHQVLDSLKTEATQSAALRTLRDHPMPLLLMGLGAAWYAVDALRAKQAREICPPEGYAAVPVTGYAGAATSVTSGDVTPYLPPGRASADKPGMVDRAKHAASRARDAVSRARGAAMGAKDKASGAASSTASGVSGAAHRAASGVSSAAGSTASAARSAASSTASAARSAAGSVASAGHAVADRTAAAAQRAQQTAAEAAATAREGFFDHPLTFGALIAAAGVAVGMLLPSTRREDRAMGRARDTAVEDLKESGADVADRAARVAQSAVDAASEEAHEQGVAPEDLKAKAAAVAASAKEAAKDEARKQDLTSEDLSREAQQTADTTREDIKRQTPPPPPSSYAA